MKRFKLVAKVTTVRGGISWTEPDLPAGSNLSVLADLPNRMLVCVNVPGGTAADNETICDIGADGQLVAASLSAAQRNAIKTRLTSWGFDVSQFDGDGVTDRAQLLRFVVRRLANRADLDSPELLRPSRVVE